MQFKLFPNRQFKFKSVDKCSPDIQHISIVTDCPGIGASPDHHGVVNGNTKRSFSSCHPCGHRSYYRLPSRCCASVAPSRRIPPKPTKPHCHHLRRPIFPIHRRSRRLDQELSTSRAQLDYSTGDSPSCTSGNPVLHAHRHAVGSRQEANVELHTSGASGKKGIDWYPWPLPLSRRRRFTNATASTSALTIRRARSHKWANDLRISFVICKSCSLSGRALMSRSPASVQSALLVSTTSSGHYRLDWSTYRYRA